MVNNPNLSDEVSTGSDSDRVLTSRLLGQRQKSDPVAIAPGTDLTLTTLLSDLHRRISKEYPGPTHIYVSRSGFCLASSIAERYWGSAVQQLK